MRIEQVFIVAFSLLSMALMAQPQKPVASPDASFTQQFGGSTITVQYARPMVRGRKIFGGLVPFDSLWRTGAGDCTTLTFKEDVIVGGKRLPAGKYSLFTIPKPDEWTVVLNSEVSMHGTMGYDAGKDVHRFSVTPLPAGRFYESFTIEVNDFNAQGGAMLNVIWENTLVPIPLESPWFASASPAASAPAASKPKPVPASRPAGLAPVYAAYFIMKDALVAENSQEAGQQAKALLAAMGAVETGQQATYAALSGKLKADAEEIERLSGDIEAQRRHFKGLSANMIALAKAVPVQEAIYVQYCPMADGNQGASWLSKESPIRNPYFGSRMLACGKVKETLR
jgi:hypothetical protein